MSIKYAALHYGNQTFGLTSNALHSLEFVPCDCGEGEHEGEGEIDVIYWCLVCGEGFRHEIDNARFCYADYIDHECKLSLRHRIADTLHRILTW